MNQDKVCDNYNRLISWYWVLCSPLKGDPQEWDYLTFSIEKPKPVGNKSMKWERPTLETMLRYNERFFRDDNDFLGKYQLNKRGIVRNSNFINGNT